MSFIRNLIALGTALSLFSAIIPSVAPKASASTNGSISLDGTNDWLTFPASSDWTIGTNEDFTIEWWQFNNSTTSFPRIFSVGSYPSASIAVSQESGTLYFWMGGAFRASASMSSTNRTWEKYAVTRTSGTIRIFKNGTQIGSSVTGNTTAATNSSSSLYIGREQNDANTIFRGYITDFNFVKGLSKYSTNYSTPTVPITASAESKLLLNAASESTKFSDSSSGAKTATAAGNPAWNSSSPYNSISNLETPSFTLSGTACTTIGRIINFSADANAISYTARLYSNSSKTTLVKTETNFSSGNAISGLTASTNYYLTLQAIGNDTTYSSSQENQTPTLYATNSTTCPASAPSAPTLNSVTAGDKRLTIAFTAGSDGGSAITDYEYSLNGGSYISAGTTSSPFTITGLNGRASYNVTLKARNSVGLGTASSTLSATTTDAALDASEAEAARQEEAKKEAARQESERIAAQKAREQKELLELLALVPAIGELSLSLGKFANSSKMTKCVKGKSTKFVKNGKKCPKGFARIK